MNGCTRALHTIWIAVASTRIRAILSLGMVLGLGTVGTLAAWSDTATATTGEFVIGSVDMKANGMDAYAFSDLSMSDMKPGHGKAAMLTVSNTGSLAVRYVATAGSSDALAQYLTISVFAGGTADNSATQGNCASVDVIGSPVTPTIPAPTVFADRPLAAAGVDDLCIQVHLVETAPATMANETAVVTLSFIGTAV